MSTIDKKLLKRLKLLYVEDDINVRNELSSLLSNFFETVYTAKDGKEGLALYKDKQNEIDVIVADINMPGLTGIEMVKEIREFDKEIPVIFATAYSDNDFLSEAIKLKVFEYIIKPIDIRNLMAILGDLASILYNDFMINQQNKELKKYKDVIFNNNIVIRTNKNMKITSVNDVFCETTGFDKKDLNGEELSILNTEDNDDIYKKIYNSVLNNKNWNGQLKNKTKDGSYYIADTSVVSTLNDKGDVTGALIIQKDETQEVIKRREVQNALIKDKGEIFIRSKENTAEFQTQINNLKDEIDRVQRQLVDVKQEKEKYLYTADNFTKENRKLKNELKRYKESSYSGDNKAISSLNRENKDLKTQITKLNLKLDSIEDDNEMNLKELKINYEVQIDDLEKEYTLLKEKLDNIDNADSIAQKIAYWKDKAKNEEKRIEELERVVIQSGDKQTIAKLFGGKK